LIGAEPFFGSKKSSNTDQNKKSRKYICPLKQIFNFKSVFTIVVKISSESVAPTIFYAYKSEKSAFLALKIFCRVFRGYLRISRERNIRFSISNRLLNIF
jgi:hypothetical protein